MKLSAAIATVLSLTFPAVSAVTVLGAGEGHCEDKIVQTYTCTGSATSSCSSRFSHDGAAYVQLSLAGTRLAAGAKLKFTSRGTTVTLTEDQLRNDHWTSPQFAGDYVRVRLRSPVGAEESRVMVTSLIHDAPCDEDAGVSSICGDTDDRVASTDVRQGRIGGCTGWLISEDVFIQAGHCGTPSTSTRMHFTFGVSSAPAEDQYAVDVSSYLGVNGGVGNDWGVGRLLPNSVTGDKPGTAQGSWYTLGTVPDSDSENNIRITGYGTAAVASRSQKTHVGALVSITGTALRYVPDTTGGNSGSPVVHEETGDAIGVHTHGGCSSTGGSNAGTRIDVPAFEAKINQMLTGTPAPTPPPTPSPTAVPCPAGESRVKVEIKTDNYPGETTWILKDVAGEGVISGSQYPSQNTLYDAQTACRQYQNYTFTINDSYGDGICCGYGQGWYKLFDDHDGDEVASGGQFGQSETKTFRTGPDGTPPPVPSPTPPPVPLPTPPPVPLPTPPPTPLPTPSPTNEPTPSPTPSPTNEPTTPAPTPPPTPPPTTDFPTFFTCEHFNEAECADAYDGESCQWIGSCHNCGCVPTFRGES